MSDELFKHERRGGQHVAHREANAEHLKLRAEIERLRAERDRLAAPLSSVEQRLIDKHCDWVAFGHAWNAIMKARRALEGKE